MYERAYPLVLALLLICIGCGGTHEGRIGTLGDDDVGPALDDDDDTASDDGDDTAGEWSLTEVGVLPLPDVEGSSVETAIAPPPGVTSLDRTVSTDFAAAVEFLYRGDSPVQVGVDPADVEPRRVAVLRGRVLDPDGAGIPDVEITVLGHGELGHTLTREDGGFDMAVNGGGLVTVRYRAAGMIPLQRGVHAPWRDYVWLPDVVMLPYDEQVTEVDLGGGGGLQVARGSAVSDPDGTRQAALLFSPDAEATAVFDDGTVEPLSTLSVRATEFTVGDTGPDAMPGDLPAPSAFTYAVELSVDEAVDAGAASVSSRCHDGRGGHHLPAPQGFPPNQTGT